MNGRCLETVFFTHLKREEEQSSSGDLGLSDMLCVVDIEIVKAIWMHVTVFQQLNWVVRYSKWYYVV